MLNGTKLVVDTGAQRAATFRDRYDAAIVPLTVVVDDVPHLEGVEIDTDAFYDRLEQGATVTTAAPAPGQFLAAYESAAAAGATGVLSVHLSSTMSGTFNSARTASEMSPVPVALLDTRTTGFGVDFCVEAAAEALLQGATVDEAVARAEEVRSRQTNVFVVGQPALLDRGGRSHVFEREIEATSLFATEPTGIVEVAKVEDLEGLLDAAVQYVVTSVGDSAIELAVGDARSPAIADRLAEVLRRETKVDEVARYAIGPSLTAHLGLGTFAATFYVR